jgi:uncharacterized membrane protein (DUF485 family)
MGGLDHHAASDVVQDNAATAERNSRLGLILFAVYLVLYVGFVLLSAFWPKLLDATPVAGLNVAILYGMGLIVAALLLALVYSWLCRTTLADNAAEAATRKDIA